jgi:hypothetical protein
MRKKCFVEALDLLMVDARKEMNDALKAEVVPALRKWGFKGTFPHFHREVDQHVDLLSFQFRLAGGSFVVELSYAEPGRENVYIDKEAPASKLRASQTSKRLRLGAEGPGSDSWFSFEPVGFFKRRPDYKGICSEVVAMLERQAIPWWSEKHL